MLLATGYTNSYHTPLLPSPIAINSSPPSSGNNWIIVHEVGDEACLLRCISRNALGHAEQHGTVRVDILQYIEQHLHDTLPNSELFFHEAIPVAIEPVQTLGSPPA